ncbi:MAG TPA: YlzJ-like family protein [Bacillales bacterium]|nr:YlzJ-like family protein [Bacillales bacterium]
MILYTMMPQELIFPYDTEDYKKQRIIMYQGVPLIVQQVDHESVEVLRIISSDPKHFLDERYAPGTKISLYNTEGLSTF